MPLTGEYAPGRAKAARRQAELYEASNGAEAADLGGYPVVVLTSIGAKTGKLRKTALMRVEHDGRYGLLASPDTSPRRPDWYYNVKANPVVELQDRAVRREYLAREAHGAERDAWWRRAVETFPPFERYQARKPGPIPIIVLEPRSAGPTPGG
jgi:F420H(2)-dependent quinone reductase